MLKLPDGGVLMHNDSIYDAAKAHEYYLRTRKLKGRKKGSAVVPVARGAAPQRTAKGSGSVTVTFKGQSYKLTPKQHAEQKAYIDKRVKAITSKIHQLESALREKMAKARKSERDSKKPKSAAEKREAAKRSEEYRDKHQQKLKSQAKKKAAEKKPNLDTVEGLKKAISDARVKLGEAVGRQRALAAASKG